MSDAADFPQGWALVVGGSGGVGGAVCERLAARGSDVALTYRSNLEAAEEAARAVAAHGRRGRAMQLDLGSAEAIDVALGAFDSDGPLHTLVYAAGPRIPMRYVSQLDEETWRGMFDADVHGFFRLVHAALPRLRESAGSLVVVSTAGLRRYVPKDVLSIAPKAAVEALARGVAREEGRFGVRANVVALGVIEAGMFLELAEGDLKGTWVDAAKQNTALKRFGTAEEVGEVVAFLASRRARYVTGQVITLDGGYSI